MRNLVEKRQKQRQTMNAVVKEKEECCTTKQNTRFFGALQTLRVVFFVLLFLQNDFSVFKTLKKYFLIIELLKLISIVLYRFYTCL